MADPRVDAVKSVLTSAGIEVYRVRADVIEIAERIRFHIMDSGVRIVLRDPLEIQFSARSQRSGNPDLDEDALFGLVRTALSSAVESRGFKEESALSRAVQDPIDPQRILDVWYEVTWTRPVQSADEATDVVRWVLTQERYVGGSGPPG